MANFPVCKYYKYGYCRYQDQCRNKHVHEICNDTNCSVSCCSKRHPKTCVFYIKYKFCKFGALCKYKHGDEAVNDQSTNDFSSILSEIMKLKEDIASLRKENDELREKLEAVELKACLVKADKNGDRDVSYSLTVGAFQEQDVSSFVTPRREPYAEDSRSFPTWSFKTP